MFAKKNWIISLHASHLTRLGWVSVDAASIHEGEALSAFLEGVGTASTYRRNEAARPGSMTIRAAYRWPRMSGSLRGSMVERQLLSGCQDRAVPHSKSAEWRVRAGLDIFAPDSSSRRREVVPRRDPDSGSCRLLRSKPRSRRRVVRLQGRWSRPLPVRFDLQGDHRKPRAFAYPVIILGCGGSATAAPRCLTGPTDSFAGSRRFGHPASAPH